MLMLILPITVFAAVGSAPLKLTIARVIDGDTIQTSFPGLPPPLDKVEIRLFGIDTPEKGSRAKCDSEAALAQKATDNMKRMLKGATNMEVHDYKWDKYGGRIDGKVFVNGVDVQQEQIKAGLAVPYFGGTKQSWCK